MNDVCDMYNAVNGKIAFIICQLISETSYARFRNPRMLERKTRYFHLSATLNEYKQKLIHLKELRENMSASDSEQELDTSDVFTLARKTHELEDLVRSLQTMEDPHMRYNPGIFLFVSDKALDLELVSV